ncbi:MAG: hydroxyacylglutathione hydrolase [Pseudomonadota bacterium]|nr:hydroxyacylglutathione hydrolase [Pseudomonadota bacterium]
MKIGYLKAFADNYIWFLRNQKEIFVIDPGESAAIINYIIANKLELKAILLTHDHHDHVGGVSDILEWRNSSQNATIDNAPLINPIYKNVPVYGGISPVDGSVCKFANTVVQDGQIIDISDEMTIKIISTPGHTYASICYLVEFFDVDNPDNPIDDKSNRNNKHLFCGDTLFAAGCGRVFTGDFAAMFNSLNRLSQLDPECYIYPGHEYTLKNLHFAQFIEPDNQLIRDRIKLEEDKLNKLGSTPPIKLAVELKTNPFLRCNEAEMVNRVNQINGDDCINFTDNNNNTHTASQQHSEGIDTNELRCFMRLRELRNNF